MEGKSKQIALLHFTVPLLSAVIGLILCYLIESNSKINEGCPLCISVRISLTVKENPLKVLNFIYLYQFPH